MFIYTFYHIQLQELALVPQKLTLQETGKTCGCVKYTRTGNHSLPIVTGVSPGPDLASEPYVTRLKGTDEETEAQGNWMRKQGETPQKRVFPPQSWRGGRKGRPWRITFLLGSVKAPRPEGPTKRGAVGGRAPSVPTSETETNENKASFHFLVAYSSRRPPTPDAHRGGRAPAE